MKKSRKSLNNLTGKKDFLNGFSTFTICAIGIYGIVLLFTCLGPYFEKNNIPALQLASELARHEFNYLFSLTEVEIIPMLIAPIAVALVQFRYIHQKEYCYTLLSFGIKRKRIYINRMLFPLIALLFITVSIKGIALWKNIAVLGFSKEIFTAWCIHVLIYLQIILVNYGITILSCHLCGRTIEAAFASLSFIFLPLTLGSFINEIFYFSLFGYSTGYNSFGEDVISKTLHLINPFPYTNAVVSASEYVLSPNPSLRNQIISSAIWSVFAILVLVLTKKYFEKKYKPEISEFKGVNTTVVYLISLTAPIYLSCFVVDYIRGYYYPYIDTKIQVITVIASLVGGILASILCNFLIHFTFKRIKVALAAGATIGAIAGILLLIGFTGVFGTYNKLPDVKEVTSVQVYAPFTVYYLDGDLAALNSEYGDSFTLPEMSTEKDIRIVQDIHETILQHREQELTGEFYVVYYLDDGSTYTRIYQNISEEALEKCLMLWETDAVKEDIKNILLPEEDEDRCYYYSKTNNETVTTEINFENSSLNIESKQGVITEAIEMITEEQFRELRVTLYKDLCNISSENWYRPTETAIGTLRMNIGSTDMVEGDQMLYTNYSCFTTPIYESMTNTVTLLKNWGLYEYLNTPQPQIKSVHIADFRDLLQANLDYIRMNNSNRLNAAYYCNNFVNPQYADAIGFEVEELTDMSLAKKYITEGYNYYLIGNNDALYVMVTYETADGEERHVGYLIPER